MKTDRKGEETATDSSAKGSRMLARTWVITSNFRSASDYGIPSAPTFTAEHRADGTLVLFACPNSTEPIITAEHPTSVRR